MSIQVKPHPLFEGERIELIACVTPREDTERVARAVAVLPDLLSVAHGVAMMFWHANVPAVRDSDNPGEALAWRAEDALRRATGIDTIAWALKRSADIAEAEGRDDA